MSNFHRVGGFSLWPTGEGRGDTLITIGALNLNRDLMSKRTSSGLCLNVEQSSSLFMFLLMAVVETLQTEWVSE